MDAIIHKTVSLIQYEHMKGLFIPSAKGQTKGTNTIIDSILPDTTTSSTVGVRRNHTTTHYNTTKQHRTTRQQSPTTISFNTYIRNFAIF